jgi:hypothetical protein
MIGWVTSVISVRRYQTLTNTMEMMMAMVMSVTYVPSFLTPINSIEMMME